MQALLGQSSCQCCLLGRSWGWAFISAAWLHKEAFCLGTKHEYYVPFPMHQKCFSWFFLLGFPGGAGGL